MIFLVEIEISLFSKNNVYGKFQFTPLNMEGCIDLNNEQIPVNLLNSELS